jgi:hypothetical protein
LIEPAIFNVDREQQHANAASRRIKPARQVEPKGLGNDQQDRGQADATGNGANIS